ncbi:MAG: DNA repair ATPase [Planctomycetaceae bacterium]|nr:DNA repair ATPase [Planctomycetaceae bacterium]
MVDSPSAPASPSQLEGGTYEILRQRLATHASDLRDRLDQLNEQRKSVFGSIDLRLLTTERITTDHNCVPRDMVAIGHRLLFGYNVHFGLKTERNIEDVFAIYRYDETERQLHVDGLDLLRDERFLKDFQEVYRYYKNATFSKFFVTRTHLYMVFQVGKAATDIKTFKWAITPDGLAYLDNRSDHEVRYPPQHEFSWIRTTRDMHRPGLHPHVSIEDRIFVETVGGDLTIKVENNTESGAGIYSEPVDDPDQTLDDADISYAVVGNCILLKVRPYQEQANRFIVYNQKIAQARRIDALRDACVLLPDDHGLIFSNGYYLQTGEHKMFESDMRGLLFERRIVSPNGEDTLFVFYQPETGVYVLLGYNVIRQQVETPIVCHGFTMFHGGEMILIKSPDQPQKHHAIQLWQTPYVGADYVPEQTTDSYLYKIGNRDIVRGMSECHELLSLIDQDDSYSGLYIDLVRQSTDILDSFFWIHEETAGNLGVALTEVRAAAKAAVDEFEKVTRVRRNTAEQTSKVSTATRETLNAVGRRRFDRVEEFVQSLANLRKLRGEVIALRDLRYVDEELIAGLEQQISASSDQLSHRCVEFLLQDDALQPYEQRIDEQQTQIGKLQKVAEARVLDEQISASGHELELLIEIVSNLKIDDATQRTRIIDNISAIFSRVNTARASLKRRRSELASTEGAAEFSSQLKLLSQSVVSSLDVCDTPEKCEEYLTRLMVQIEELEGKFAEFDDFLLQLVEKREDVSGAFESRRMQLVEQRNRRANSLAQAADRILKGIRSRVSALESIQEIHGYFAADLMVDKVRDLIGQLTELDDSVKAEDIQSRLKTIREDAVRQLKDRQELFEEGASILRFGQHRFSVNTQLLDLTTVLRDDRLHLHLTGTEFYEPLDKTELNETRPVWGMEVCSENADVYRAEYLAYRMFRELGNAIDLAESNVLAAVQQFMAPRYVEGYTKGVHDHDAALLIRALCESDQHAGLLRYSPQARALASYCWRQLFPKAEQQLMEAALRGMGHVARLFPQTQGRDELLRRLRRLLQQALAPIDSELEVSAPLIDEAAQYLFAEFTGGDLEQRGDAFAVSQTAADLVHAFQEYLHTHNAEDRFQQSVKALADDPLAAWKLAQAWLDAFQPVLPAATRAGLHQGYIAEAGLLCLERTLDERRILSATTHHQLSGLIGSHGVIGEGGRYEFDLHRFVNRLRRFESETLPAFERYHQLKGELVDRARAAMKLSEFQPRVLSSFVRNRLIDEVYLPLIGDNLAKQIGTAGDAKRTDRQGLLLLISPPGYGKTTLMEYIANRLGIIFVKVNGPALGHQVTSLDPAAAPNAGAREEIEKLNLALEMGDNVMLYLDDIQHCHPEFLQKFISLCDAQRKIEGVWKGQTRTYDFRGKKVAVVMAGNPYTESGEKFQIPDMLANRADIYNLGEIIGETREAFEMSYLENALTSNPILAKLAARSQQDVYAVIKLAEQERRRESAGPLNMQGIDFEGSYSMEELGEFVATMTRLMRVRDVVLQVNREYIASAAQHDDYRTEPPFLLQGSYRNMNRIGEKVLPVMNATELETLIGSSYQNDAQTLTSGTEANLLKFKELLGTLTADEQTRWDQIRRTYQQNVKLRGLSADDHVGQVIATLMTFSDGLNSIREALQSGVQRLSADRSSAQAQAIQSQLAGMTEQLTQGLDRLTEAARQSAEAAMHRPSRAGLPSPPTNDAETSVDAAGRLTIVNRIPRTVLNVMETQFDLMQNWLRPLSEMTTRQTADLESLRPMVEECLQHYRVLLRKLEEAHERESSEDE